MLSIVFDRTGNVAVGRFARTVWEIFDYTMAFGRKSAFRPVQAAFTSIWQAGKSTCDTFTHPPNTGPGVLDSPPLHSGRSSSTCARGY